TVLGQDGFGMELDSAKMRSGDEVHIAGRRIGLNVDSRRQGGALPRNEGIVKTHRFGPVQYPKPGLRALKDDIFVDQVQSELAGKTLVAQADGQQRFSYAHEFVDGRAHRSDFRVVCAPRIAGSGTDDGQIIAVEHARLVGFVPYHIGVHTQYRKNVRKHIDEGVFAVQYQRTRVT